MKIFKAQFTKIKKIFESFKMCKKKLKECQEKINFLNTQIEEYNKLF